MNLVRVLLVAAAATSSAEAVSIDYDKVEPFPQPSPVTVSEKAAVKFKPRLLIADEVSCVPFLVVNAAGETGGGLKGNGGNDGCEVAPLGAQVYGRSSWHNDGFWDGSAFWRHDWASAVVWIDNPALEAPKVVRLSLSTSKDSYKNRAPASFVNGTAPFLLRYLPGMSSAALITIDKPGGDFQDLIMWEQLTDVAREALNNAENFGRADVPFSDNNFPTWLEKAWPL
ncbi:necrosis inducing-like protein NPP1 type [Phytophthora sojae]|uniref:Necrosis inducing-like protein NPP1 type n=1 Tax=Phytophthora sojae (strain P6497) TaxID=1094619 RepID=G4Z8U6_PHYSP|nr:necrosis inducing-like protein NPP1 type [Phytophthora sojae]EGZ19717.1 necrosis inducing-like protein NPP1 type [Phytophthora sojae]|eukprot:XP_009522434.1 necrosis inducing-like protein NPP1 type [Phytophthora sojae]